MDYIIVIVTFSWGKLIQTNGTQSKKAGSQLHSQDRGTAIQERSDQTTWKFRKKINGIYGDWVVNIE